MPKTVQPTVMQSKAMELIRQGKTPTEAMRQAGYAESVVEAPKQNLLSSPGAQSIIEQYKDAYARVGITQDYMAGKTKEWLEAKKVHTSHTEPDKFVPDYQTQIKAAEMVRQDWGMGPQQGLPDEGLIMWKKK